MVRPSSGQLRHALGLLVVLAAVGAGRARAQGISVQLEPAYTTSSTTLVDHGTGTSTRTDFQQFIQRYRLNLDREIFPLLRLSAGGIFDKTLGSSTTEGIRSDFDSTQWNGSTRLAFGSPILSGAVGYDRREQSSQQTTGGLTLRAPSFVRENYDVFGQWRPADLPFVDARASRTNDYDKARQATDITTDQVLVSSGYAPVRQLDLRYLLQYSTGDDRIHQSQQREIDNVARVTWSDTLLDRRLSTYASYTLNARSLRTVASRAGATVATQQFPTAGFSLVEAFPATPERDTLTSNPALIDGNTDLSTGIDLGVSRALAGDTAPRDMGAQFGNALSEVNTVYVWVDRQLPADIAGAYAWDVYRSDDNVTWTRVNTTGAASGGPAIQFSPFQNRFEITIERTQARYLKVVTRPLSAAVTVDQRYANVLVTELQFYLILPVGLAPQTSSTIAGILSTTARYVIFRSPNLAYDFSFLLAHTNNPARKTYNVSNGLSFSQRLSRIFGVSARADRTDSDETVGHVAVSRISASLAVDPLATLGGTLTYSGQILQNPSGTGFNNGVSAFEHADLYKGVSLSSNASYNAGTNELGQATRNALFGASLSVTPNRAFTLSGSYVYSYQSIAASPTTPGISDRSGRVEATASFSPFPAFYVSAGASRFVSGRPPSTLANLAVNLSPFPRGDLQARFAYSETLDQASDSRTRSLGPSVRWNIRSATYLDVSYTLTDTYTPAVDTRARVLFADLVVTFR